MPAIPELVTIYTSILGRLSRHFGSVVHRVQDALVCSVKQCIEVQVAAPDCSALAAGTGRSHGGRHVSLQMRREEFAASPPGMQVWSDVLRRKPTRLLTIDDKGESWPVWCRDHLMRTDEVLGISEPGALAELQDQA